MIKLQKIALIFILSISLIACSTGTGGTESSHTSGGNGEDGAVVELKFWDMVWGPPEYIEAGQALVEQFNQEHPNIKVTYQSTPWNNWYQTFTTAIASGTGPDISTGGGYQAFQFYDMDEILPIDDVIEEWRAEGKLDDFFPGMVDTLKYDGHYVALPWATDARVWYYRKDLFEEAGVQPPKNFQELREAAKQLTGDGQYGIVVPAVDNGGVQFLLTLLINNGGGIFTEDKKVDFMNERNVEVLQWMSDLVKDGSINPAGTGFKSDDAIKSFGQGNAAIYLTNPGFKNELPEIIDQIGLLPPMEGLQGDKGTLRWVNNLMIYKSSKHPEEAKTFLKWWSENNQALWLEGNSHQLPARMSFAQDDFFQQDPILKQILDEYIPIGQTTGARYPSAFAELNEIEGEGVLHTLSQEIILGKDPIEMMQQADARLKEIMKE